MTVSATHATGRAALSDVVFACAADVPAMVDERLRRRAHTCELGEDARDVRDWTWLRG